MTFKVSALILLTRFDSSSGILICRSKQIIPKNQASMQFSKSLQDRVKNGEITSSVRFWKTPQVMSGGHYRLDPGEVIVTSIREIGFNDISETMANESGFSAVEDLLKTAQHGTGLHIYFIRFYYSDNN